MNGRARLVGAMVVPLVVLAGCGPTAVSGSKSDVRVPAVIERPPRRPAVTAAVDHLVREPGNKEYRRAVADPALRDDAWPLLERVVRQPVPEQPGPIHWRSDNTDVLDAMADIYGERSAGLLIELAQSAPDAAMRSTAVGRIAWPLKLETPAAHRAVLRALDDPDGGVVMSALSYIKSHALPEAGPAVAEILRHPPEKPMPAWTRGEERQFPKGHLFDDALSAIGSTRYPGAVDDLLTLTRDGREYDRRRATTALGQCGQNDSDAARHGRTMDRLAVLLRDPAFEVRTAAAASLAFLGDDRGGPTLARAIRVCQAFKPGDRQFLDVCDAVRGLEAITHADFQSSLGDDAWRHWYDWPDKDEKFTLKDMLARIDALAAELRRRGINPADDPPLPTRLSDAQKRAFDVRFGDDLADPCGGSLVTYEYPLRTCWGSVRSANAEGWMFPAGPGIPARLVSDDAQPVPVYVNVKPVDLVADTRRVVARVIESATVRDRLGAGSYEREIRDNLSSQRAAWLYRLGDEQLAAQSLAIVRGPWADDATPQPEFTYVWGTYERAINDYIVRDDDAAYARLQRHRRLHPGEVENCAPAMKLLAELDRRKIEGSFVHQASPTTMPTETDHNFGHFVEPPPFKGPDGFDRWPVDRRVAWLIHELQEMDQRQQGQPGGVDVSADPRVQALVAVGDAAVPALIDCIDSDERLTRSVQFWRDFAEGRNIIGVRECALSAVESILGTSVFEPASTGDTFTGRGESAAHRTAEQLRAYWDKYRALPYAKRMMSILTDPKSSTAAASSAANALAHYNEERRFGTQVWTGGAKPKPGTNPVINQFQNPTVAEAILDSYDRAVFELEHPTRPQDKPSDYDRKRLKDGYPELLVSLRDRRITTALMDRGRPDGSADDLRRWAAVCMALGEERPMFDLARRFKAGRFDLGPVDPEAGRPLYQPGNSELTAWVKCFGELENPFLSESLATLADPAHPYHARAVSVVRQIIVNHAADTDTQKIWAREPVYVRLARPLMDDPSPTGRQYSHTGTELWEHDEHGTFRFTAAGELTDPAVRRDVTSVRVCDLAAAAVSEALAGGPDAHALYKDADDRLDRLRRFVDAHPRLRPLPGAWAWQAGFSHFSDGPTVCPVVPVTGHPATAADVAAGVAVFYLDGSTSTGQTLPLLATWTPAGRNPQKVLVIQAERDRAGGVHYGILGRHALQQVPPTEVSDVKPMDFN